MVVVVGLSLQELMEKFHSERDDDKLKYEAMLKQQQSFKLEFDKMMQDNEVSKQMELSMLEQQFQQKIMNELERFASPTFPYVLAYDERRAEAEYHRTSHILAPPPSSAEHGRSLTD